MRIFDCHTHIHFPAYDLDRDEVIKRAQAAGVKMVCVGTQTSTSESAIKLAQKYSNDIWATVGFHPSHVNQNWHHDSEEQKETAPEKFDIEKLRNLAKHPKVVAIGECGLDYYRLNQEAEIRNQEKARQKDALLAQIEIAAELKKPLMLHVRPSKGADDAYEDLLALLSRAKAARVIHFYGGVLEITKKFVERGFYFTFGGVVTFTEDYDEVIKYIPLKQILLETDAPYVAPTPYRGKRNEPAYIIETAKKISAIKNMEYDEVCETTFLNTLTALNLSI